MKLLRRLLGAIVVLLSTIGFICCMAGIVGAWKVQQETSQKVKQVTAQVDVGLERASVLTKNIHHALEKANDDVAVVNKKAADLGNGPETDRMAMRFLRDRFQNQLGPNVNEMRGRLDTLSDAAVALSSLIQSLADLPTTRLGHLDPEKVERSADQAAQLSAALLKLQATLGEGNQSASEKEVVDAANAVRRVLEKCQAILDEWQRDLTESRAELKQVEARVLGWLMLAAVIVTALCAWGAVSQLSLLAHGWKWLWWA